MTRRHMIAGGLAGTALAGQGSASTPREIT